MQQTKLFFVYYGIGKLYLK